MQWYGTSLVFSLLFFHPLLHCSTCHIADVLLVPWWNNCMSVMLMKIWIHVEATSMIHRWSLASLIICIHIIIIRLQQLNMFSLTLVSWRHSMHKRAWPIIAIVISQLVGVHYFTPVVSWFNHMEFFTAVNRSCSCIIDVRQQVLIVSHQLYDSRSWFACRSCDTTTI